MTTPASLANIKRALTLMRPADILAAEAALNELKRLRPDELLPLTDELRAVSALAASSAEAWRSVALQTALNVSGYSPLGLPKGLLSDGGSDG